MSWLTRRPQTSDPVNYVTVGLNKTILLVGLGNPGKKYELTRHNAGFICIDEFVDKTEEMEKWVEKKDLKCLLSTGRLGESRVIAVKPTTYMNNSGEAVRAVTDFYKITNDQIAVIHDELDIGFGQIRLRVGGSPAGHNGIKSVSAAIGEDYARVRIGVGPKKPAAIKAEDFVLQKFSAEQQKQLLNMRREVLAILIEYLYGGQLPHDTRSFII